MGDVPYDAGFLGWNVVGVLDDVDGDVRLIINTVRFQFSSDLRRLLEK